MLVLGMWEGPTRLLRCIGAALPRYFGVVDVVQSAASLVAARALASASQRILATEAFEVDGTVLTWSDVRVASELRGDWGPWVVSVATSVAALEALNPIQLREFDSSLPAIEAAFRRKRGFFRADDFTQWLGKWGLSRVDLGAWLRRQEAVQRGATPSDIPSADDVADIALADAALSGFLEEQAWLLGADLALVAERGALTLEGGASQELPSVLNLSRRIRCETVREIDVTRLLEARALEWTRVTGTQLTLPSLDAAREAALCVKLDGLSLEEVAEGVGREIHAVDTTVEDALGALAPHIAAAQPGALLGPVQHEGQFLLVEVAARITPNDDPLAKTRAQGMLLDRAVNSAVEKHIRWAWHG
jgi:hypothetical protein